MVKCSQILFNCDNFDKIKEVVLTLDPTSAVVQKVIKLFRKNDIKNDLIYISANHVYFGVLRIR